MYAEVRVHTAETRNPELSKVLPVTGQLDVGRNNYGFECLATYRQKFCLLDFCLPAVHSTSFSPNPLPT